MSYILIFLDNAEDIDWLGPQGLDLHRIKERGNENSNLKLYPMFFSVD